MKFISLLIFSCFVSNITFANCSKPVEHLIKDQVAPCEGYLFSPQKEKQIRKINEEYKILMEEVKVYIQKEKALLDILEVNQEELRARTQQVELWKNEAKKQQTEKLKQEEHNKYVNWLCFAGGVAATSLAVFGAGHLGSK